MALVVSERYSLWSASSGPSFAVCRAGQTAVIIPVIMVRGFIAVPLSIKKGKRRGRKAYDLTRNL